MTIAAQPSVEDSGSRLLLALLATIAGDVDVLGFLWHGTFVAHITGNLILVAARVVDGTPIGLSTVLSVPTFIVMLAVVNAVTARFEAANASALVFLLGIQCAFLAGLLVGGTAAGTEGSPDSTAAVLALMSGVSALATQHALVQVTIRGAPSTAVMTTNLTRLVHDLVELVFRNESRLTEAAKARAAKTWPTVAGFTTGAAAGAAVYAVAGIQSAVLPFGLALVALGATWHRHHRCGGRYWGWSDSERKTQGTNLFQHLLQPLQRRGYR